MQTELDKWLYQNVSDEQARVIMNDFDTFENQGFIGDCDLRDVSERINTEVFFDSANIAIVMNFVYAAVCKRFAMYYLKLERNSKTE